MRKRSRPPSRLTDDRHAALFEVRVIGGDPSQTIGQDRDHDGSMIGLRRFF